MNIDIFNDTVANINKELNEAIVANISKELNEAIEAAKKSERNYVSGLEVQDILWRNLGIHVPVNLSGFVIWNDKKGDKIDV